jgi:hypothetical protein
MAGIGEKMVRELIRSAGPEEPEGSGTEGQVAGAVLNGHNGAHGDPAAQPAGPAEARQLQP